MDRLGRTPLEVTRVSCPALLYSVPGSATDFCFIHTHIKESRTSERDRREERLAERRAMSEYGVAQLDQHRRTLRWLSWARPVFESTSSYVPLGRVVVVHLYGVVVIRGWGRLNSLHPNEATSLPACQPAIPGLDVFSAYYTQVHPSTLSIIGHRV